MVHGPYGWQEAKPRPSPAIAVSLTVHGDSYAALALPVPESVSGHISPGRVTSVPGIADTGAQMNVLPTRILKSMGISAQSLFPLKARVSGASRGSVIDVVGGIILEVEDTGQSGASTLQLFYVADNVNRLYLSLDTCIGLGITEPDFPKIQRRQGGKVCSAGELPSPSLPACSNTGVVGHGDQPCSCPKRALPPTDRPVLPCPATPENLAIIKQYILDRYAPSAFNCCERQKLPMLQDTPPLRLFVDPDATPVAAHIPAPVPLHWQEAVKAGLDRDCRLGVLERVPPNTPVIWLSRMVLQAKANGEPRRTVDYQALNKHAPRQTHHTRSPWQIVSSIPAGVKKSTLDNWHGYHSLRIAPEDSDLTQFVTTWGRYRYLTAPQGLLSAGDAFTQRLDIKTEGIERLERCVDDNLLYDMTIEEQFFRVCDYLALCARDGVIFNPKKFQFAEDVVDFLGFTVTASGVTPTSGFMKNILNFPSPKNITDVRSWFGAVAQISYSFASALVMAPFRHLLSPKVPFSWSAELESAFQASKAEIVSQCEKGVRSFSSKLPTCLATDWSKLGIGFWLCQKHCDCETNRPGCCKTGWQTVCVNSRFCTPAESRYAPIEGESLAASWGVEKCRHFLLGLPHFVLALDHNPLITIMGGKDLGAITNHRIMAQKVKLLPYRFTPVFVPGKAHVVPDCWSRRGDPPGPLAQPATTHPTVSNVGPGYPDELGPPDWVSGPLASGGRSYAEVAAATEQDSHKVTRGMSPGDSGQARSYDQSRLGLTASSLQQATERERNECEELEQAIASAGRAAVAALRPRSPGQASFEDWDWDFVVAALPAVSIVTWDRLRAAGQESPLYQDLIAFLRTGVLEDKSAWPENLRPYHAYRHNLQVVDEVVLYADRPLIPVPLRPQILEHLHAAHSGVTAMYGRACQAVFWPNLKQDIIDTRLGCRACTLVAPSNPAMPPSEPTQPDYPFSHCCADFFTYKNGTYLGMVDRYSGWLSLYKLPKDDSANVTAVLRKYFACWGAPKELSTDGATVFTSVECKDFLDRWGVRLRVSSAYFARSNKRAEVAVKSAKRLVMENLGPNGSLNTDRIARALLMHRNQPDPETGLSPAMVVLGRQMRDHLPAQTTRYEPRKEWRLEADMREKAFAKRHLRMCERLSIGAKQLPPLACGDTVVVQDQTAKDKGKAGRWTKTGSVVEVHPHDSYTILIHGSRQATRRNRQFIRKIDPYSPVIPGFGPVVRRAAPPPEPEMVYAPEPAEQVLGPPGPGLGGPEPAPVAPEPAAPALDRPRLLLRLPTPVVTPPTGNRTFDNQGPAEAHRRAPVAAPGDRSGLQRLKELETQGVHLALEAWGPWRPWELNA
jgi:hypothetical protein